MSYQVYKTHHQYPRSIEMKVGEGDRVDPVIKNLGGVIRSHYSKDSEADTGKQRVPTRTHENPIKYRADGRDLVIRPGETGPNPRDFADSCVPNESIESIGQWP